MSITFKTDNYYCKKLNVNCKKCKNNFDLIAPSSSDICIFYSTEVAEYCYASIYGDNGVKSFIDKKIESGMTMEDIYDHFTKPSVGRYEFNAKLRCVKCNSTEVSVIDVIEDNIKPELHWLEYN